MCLGTDTAVADTSMARVSGPSAARATLVSSLTMSDEPGDTTKAEMYIASVAGPGKTPVTVDPN